MCFTVKDIGDLTYFYMYLHSQKKRYNLGTNMFALGISKVQRCTFSKVPLQ